MPTVLIVEDERDLAEILSFNLKKEGFAVAVVHDGQSALERVKRERPDLVVLDLMLPDLPGTEVCRQLRAKEATRALPVLMLTAKGEEIDRVVGFELGADDYVVKPFSVRELVLRVKALLKRASPQPAERAADVGRTKVGAVRIEPESHRCFVGTGEVVLTAMEFKLLQTFMNRLGRVQTREQLLQDVWGITSDVETRTVDTHLNRLREKLGEARELLETVRGVGYRMVAPAGEG